MRNFLSHLSIRTQVLLPVLFTVIIVLSGLGLADIRLNAAFDDATVTMENAIEQKDDLVVIIDHAGNMRIKAIYSLFNRDDLKDYISILKKEVNETTQILTQLRSIEGISTESQRAMDAIQAYFDFSQNTMFNLLETKHNETYLPPGFEQQYAQASNQYRQLGVEMEASINQLSDAVNRLAEASIQSAEANHDRVSQWLKMVMFAGLVVALVFAAWLASLIIAPITRLQSVMKKVEQGDLSVEFVEPGKNEMAQLSNSVTATLSQLRITVTDLSRVSEDVAAASTELATVMVQATANSDQECQEIEQVASAVNQLESTAQHVNTNAVDADNTARNASDMTSQGLALFNESHQASERMTNQLSEAADVVNSLKLQSEKIGNVIEVIESISEQTNLLALNAAIEAARAGESGRGFAVVADEVRMLAARTQESTREIQSIIEELQAKSGEANDSVNMSMEMLEQNRQLSGEVTQALEGISQAVNDMTSINTQVASAAEEQSQVTADINRNVINIQDIVNQNVTGINQSAAASRELSTLAEDQKNRLSFFKL
ncbi:methyl-accepting chemotaxis protein [Vibrio agarivorans]|uniref:Methyl-accepting chemotaxis protein n=1 Tax=Vibrio agarivorans TaxID=153622 RepID=A0ABT7Y6W7_9VIBR|nr:methyl-accepting chemotaxis protein [Vibrio agarivorans]